MIESTMNSQVVMLLLWVFDGVYDALGLNIRRYQRRETIPPVIFLFHPGGCHVIIYCGPVLMKLCGNLKKLASSIISITCCRIWICYIPFLNLILNGARSGQRCYAYPKDQSTCRGVGIDGSRGWHVWRKFWLSMALWEAKMAGWKVLILPVRS